MGVYLGHERDGSPEALPSFARLYSALVHAAATGISCSEDRGQGDVTVAGDARRALTWLEENPPEYMSIPEYHTGRSWASTAFRKEGVFRSELKTVKYKVTERSIGEGTALADAVAWIWDVNLPEDLLGVIDRMCADVAYLGESSSRVILELVDEVKPTHKYLQSRGFFSPGGFEVELPTLGRLDSLEQQFMAGRPKKRPTKAADKHTLAMPSSEIPIEAGLIKRRIVRVDEDKSLPVPWDGVVAIPIEKGPKVKSEERVALAVAFHRALISVIGTGAPASITGKYLEGMEIPANRVAIQYLPAGMPVQDELEDCAHFLLLLPLGLGGSDLGVLAQALERLRVIRTRLGKFELAPELRFMRAADFWGKPVTDSPRQWTIDPAAVPERWIRGEGQAEVYGDTIAWSFGNIIRDLPGVELKNQTRLRRKQLEGAGFRVDTVKPLVTRHPERYVHRTNKQMPIMPYVGTLEFGRLLPPTALVSIGQSRHLGGGLLIPVDLATREG